jgi:methylated-DNA-[protein]-cysteine S-methyltransferase
MNTSYCNVSSPIGELILVTDGVYLQAVLFGNESMSPFCLNQAQRNSKHPVLKETGKQLQEYFSGKRTVFQLPLPKVLPGTSFQNRVWKALREIPYGETCSYQDVARRIGSPLACRAVGMANNKNPIAIIIPCHRVIGKSGDLVGYGAGLDKKRYLLALEKKG